MTIRLTQLAVIILAVMALTTGVARADGSADVLSPASQAAIDNATSASITCTTNVREPHYRLIYSRPYGSPDRSATVVPQLRSELYKASAYLAQQTALHSPGFPRKLRVLCSGGIPTVDVVMLPTAAAQETFSTIRANLRTAGFNSPDPHQARYLVYHDSTPAGGPDGQAEVLAGGLREPYSNNNKADAYAIQYGPTFEPMWSVVLHEIFHNLGAINADAPGYNGHGHCVDGRDLMCYTQNGVVTQIVCTYTELDCGRDTYCHAGTPPAGSYLATHWNACDPMNRWLDHGSLNVDYTAPSKPGAPSVDTLSFDAIEVSWAPAIDDEAVTGYRVDLSSNGATVGFAPLTTVTGTMVDLSDAIAPGATRWVRVHALDAADHVSAASASVQITAPADTTAPSVPTGVASPAQTFTTIDVTWNASTDNDRVDAYLIDVFDGTVWSTRATVAGNELATTLTGFTASSTVRVGVRARDRVGNVSARSSSIEVSTSASLTPPPAPTELSASAIASGITVSWAHVSDPAGVTHYDVQLVDGHGLVLAQQTINALASFSIATVPGRTYTASIRAVNGSGIAGSWASVNAVAFGAPAPPPPAPQPPVTKPPAPTPPVSKRDTHKPTRPGRPRVTRSTRSTLRVTWKASRDNVRVTRYRVYVAVGKRGRFRLTRTQTGRTYTIRKLRRNTTYRIRIRAFDRAGNASTYSPIRTTQTRR